MRAVISIKMIMINDWLRRNKLKPSVDLILYSKLKAHTFIITYRLLISYFDEDYL